MFIIITVLRNFFILHIIKFTTSTYGELLDFKNITCAAYKESSSYHKTHFSTNRSVIVHLFEWTFLDIADECRTFLGPKGFGGVQLSPALEHVFIKTPQFSHPWWERYEIISYQIASRSGNESHFWTMSRICNDNGVRLYADVNLNHMAALPSTYLNDSSLDELVLTSSNRSVNISNYNYPEVPYTAEDFHHQFCNDKDFKNKNDMRNCQRRGHPDLNLSHEGVKDKLIGMLNHYVKMGVAGFRVDAAKYTWPKDIKHIFDHVTDLNVDFNFPPGSRPFVYYDVFDLNLDKISKTEYSRHGIVSEYLYGIELANIINGKVSLTALINWGPAMGFVSSQNALVFVDSHDTQRVLLKELMGDRKVLTYQQRSKYVAANAFMLAHPFGRIKRIMSSYYYPLTDVHRGPPFTTEGDEDENDKIRSPSYSEYNQCLTKSGWVCEHRWPVIVQMVAFANYFSIQGQQEQKILYFQTHGPNQIAFCRGYKAFIAMNNDPIKEFSKSVYTCLPTGRYCDIVTGGITNVDGELSCAGLSLLVNERGYAELQLPPRNDEKRDNNINELEEKDNAGTNYGILIVYLESKV